MGKFILPKIKGVTIHGFSLYKQKDEIKLAINDGVFCLAGANGLGKSTFISILSYALLGIVVNPRKSFASINRIPKFFQESEKFAATYFKGRVDESKRDSANVEIVFLIGNIKYKIKRLFFDNSGLMSFSRIDLATGVESINQDISSSALLASYKEYFIKDVKLDSYEQFSFIHSFILTFDESKQLLFWNEALMNRVLHIFFGVDPQEAEKADDLRKDIARHGSNMRNLQWEITKSTRDLDDLIKTNAECEADSELIERIKAQLEGLEASFTELTSSIENDQIELKETLTIISDRSLKVSNLKMQYQMEFNNMYSFNKIPVEKDSRIIDILRSITTKVIDDLDIASEIQELKSRIKEMQQQHQTNGNSLKILQEIDKKLFKYEEELKNNYLRKDRLEVQINQNQTARIAVLESIEQFKESNDQILRKAIAFSQTNHVQEIEFLKSIIAKKEVQKDKETHFRNSKTAQLEEIETRIQENYHTAKEIFIPVFKDYANSFLGLDIDVDFRKSENGLFLVLKVNDTERTEKFQLSESQRYFIDIALRFALVEYVSSNAYMLIDTPEGSLDIAYESRAGKMFADFVTKGYDVIMTANINTSQLLLQMAEKCGASKMYLERMTNWTVLSSVQQEEHRVIECAFKNIEDTLVRNDA